MRRALLIGSVALNALLVIVLCSSLLSSHNVGTGAIRANTRTRTTAPLRMARNTAVHARKGMNVEQMKRDFQKTMGAAALSGVAAMHTFPAQALVDARMNGDGAGIPLGINDSRLFFILAVVFTGIWALYASSVKTISDNDDEDSGLNLS